MKKKIMASLGLLAPVAVFAEGTTPSMDTTTAASMISSASDGLTGLLTTVAPYITTLVLAGLAIWAALVIIKLVKRGFSRAG